MLCSPYFLIRDGILRQIIKRKFTPETKAGQYMCRECGQIFNTKKEVDKHIRTVHELN
jgi:hypothetical protein